MCEYENVNTLIATIVVEKLATYHELDTVYSLEDALDMFEIIAVNRENEARSASANKEI